MDKQTTDGWSFKHFFLNHLNQIYRNTLGALLHKEKPFKRFLKIQWLITLTMDKWMSEMIGLGIIYKVVTLGTPSST